MSVRPSKSRPSDLVLSHLHSMLGLSGLPVGTRLPAAVDLAKTLGISQGTVKNVYRRLAAEGKVRTRSGDGSFWLGEREEEAERVYHIGIDLPERSPLQGSPSRWGLRLYGGIMQKKLALPYRVQFHACERLRFHADGALVEPVPILKELDGVLLLSLLRHPLDTLVVDGRKVPCIALNPYYDDASRNFVAPDYFSISYRLGAMWRKVGFRRIVALMSPGLNESVSVRLRYGGLLSGLNLGSGEKIEVRLLSVPAGTEAHGFEAVNALLKEGDWVPDAVYAAGDGLAFGAINALEQHSLKVPGDTSVIGGNGADFLKYPPRILSCTEHGLERLGERMIELLMERIMQGGVDMPAYIEPSRFFMGTTTSEAENALMAGE